MALSEGSDTMMSDMPSIASFEHEPVGRSALDDAAAPAPDLGAINDASSTLEIGSDLDGPSVLPDSADEAIEEEGVGLSKATSEVRQLRAEQRHCRDTHGQTHVHESSAPL